MAVRLDSGKEVKGMSFAKLIVVQKLPAELTAETAERFLAAVEPILDVKRPLVVFDFSAVQHFDSAGVAALLRCLEEVLKRNGDLKLAAIPAPSIAVLEMTGVDRLFEIFENASDAANSFHQIRGYSTGATGNFAPAARFAAGSEIAI
jgi:anti-sigma B factor antagonist